MTGRVLTALAALLLLAPAGGRGQWRGSPMPVPAAGAQVLAGRFSAGAAGDELLCVDRATGAGTLRAHRSLLSTSAWPFVLPDGATPLSAGRTRGNGEDLLADVAYPQGGNLVVRYGNQPGIPVVRGTFAPLGPVGFVHALPLAADAVAFTNASIGSGLGGVVVADFDPASPLGGTMVRGEWAANGLSTTAGAEHRVFGVGLSPAALALAIDDLALPTAGGVFLLAHRPATQDLLYATAPALPSALQLVEVRVGGPSPLERPPWLPASVPRKGDALGAAAIDLDLDGTPDLLFGYGSHVPAVPGEGRLIAVSGTGDPLDLATSRWQDVTAQLQLDDPSLVRQVAVGGAPAAAIWDRGRGEIVVAWAEGGALRTWRGAGAEGPFGDLRVADLVGSSAPDLVAIGDGILVYPDLGDASPSLAWAGGGPPAPARGEDLALSVSALDPDGDCTVEWFAGSPDPTSLVSVARVPGGAARVLSWVMPGSQLCEAPPQTVAVTVRATDALGVFDELSFAAPVTSPPPLLALSAGGGGGRLPLPPGGTSLVLDGSAPARCAPGVTFSWSGTLFAAVPTFVEEGSPTTTRRTVTVAEASYPALLAEPAPAATLVALDGGVESPPATASFSLDAGGLVAVRHEADLAVLGPGEVAVLRTTLESNLAVALPMVRVVDRLVGLAPAGAPRVSGAAVVATGRGGAEVVLAEVPAAGAEPVVIELPVRSTGEQGRSAVEARSSAGWLLTPPAGGGDDASLPGCGCGAGGGGAGILALLLALAARRLRRARPRAT